MVLYRLMIIGEASKNIPDYFKTRHDSVPWKSICGLRDVLIHHYYGVDLDHVWEILSERLPTVKIQIQKIIEYV